MLPPKDREHHNGPDGTVLDISQLATTYLGPRKPTAKTRAQQIAHHEAEIRHVLELVSIVELALTTLVFRLSITTDQGLLKALRHNRRDLQRYQDELVALQKEHENAIERIQSQQ